MGQKKCFQIHVGKKAPQLCPQLSVHDETTKTTSSETYIGDIFFEWFEHLCKIWEKYWKIKAIFSLLQDISVGEYYFEMAMLFRSSMLINSILCSSEVLYWVKSKHLQILKRCDKLFLCPTSWKQTPSQLAAESCIIGLF